MYKIIQNYLESNEYEYSREYETLEEAQVEVREFMKEDAEEGALHGYTILNEEQEDEEEKIAEQKYEYALLCLIDIGLTQDEAERQLEDIKL